MTDKISNGSNNNTSAPLPKNTGETEASPPLSTQMTTSTDTKHYLASYSQRAAAIVIDMLIFGLLGLLLGSIFNDFFVQLGNWGRLIGLTLTLLYFAYGDSALTKGQTLGKKVLDIRVIHRDGSYLSNAKSALRYLIFYIPFMINGLTLPSGSFGSVLLIIVSMLIFGSFLTQLYLIVANKQRKQLLHDILVDSIVVKAKSTSQHILSTPIRALKVSAVIFLLSGAIALFTSKGLQGTALQDTFNELQDIQTIIQTNPAVRSVQVNAVTSTTLNNAEESRTQFLSIAANLNQEALTDAALAKDIARQAIANYSEAEKLSHVTVVLIYGYNIGIASSSRSQIYNFQPSELIEKTL